MDEEGALTPPLPPPPRSKELTIYNPSIVTPHPSPFGQTKPPIWDQQPFCRGEFFCNRLMTFPLSIVHCMVISSSNDDPPPLSLTTTANRGDGQSWWLNPGFVRCEGEHFPAPQSTTQPIKVIPFYPLPSTTPKTKELAFPPPKSPTSSYPIITWRIPPPPQPTTILSILHLVSCHFTASDGCCWFVSSINNSPLFCFFPSFRFPLVVFCVFPQVLSFFVEI